MNYIDSLRYKAGVLGDPDAKRRLSAAGKKGAQTRKANKAFIERVLDQLHYKPEPKLDPESPVLNDEGDLVPGYAL